MVNELNIIVLNILIYYCVDERVVMLDKNFKSLLFGYNFLEEYVGVYGEFLFS